MRMKKKPAAEKVVESVEAVEEGILEAAAASSDISDVDQTKRPLDYSKPLGILLTVLVAIAVAVSAFVGVTLLTQLDIGHETNRDRIIQNCQDRNDQVLKMNAKFAQLSTIFDLAIAQKLPEDRPMPQVVAALEEFRRPIELIDCSDPLRERR